jgi:hypothetical protein
MIGLILLAICLISYFRRSYTLSISIFFFLITNGFQLVPIKMVMAGLPIDKGSDLALIFLVMIVFGNFAKLKVILHFYPVLKWAIFVIIFVIMDALYSIVFLHYSIVNVIQVFRPYLFVLSFVLFFVIPLSSLKKVFHGIAIITVIQGALFLLQVITKSAILLSINGDENVIAKTIEGSGFVRFYNSPVFLFPALFYFLYVFRFKSKFLQYAILGILIAAVIGPAHRSAILSLIFVISLYSLLKQSLSNRITYIAIIGVAIFLASFVPLISTRIDETLIDVRTTFSADLSLNSIDIQENTSTFRIGHFLERYTYAIGRPFGWLFGIGLISENASYVTDLPFQFGLISEVTGRVVQVDTGDLIWSPLVLTLGLVGTFIYVIFFGRLMIFMFRRIEISKYAVCNFLTLAYCFVVSFTSVTMLDITFRVIVMMLFVIVAKIELSKSKMI